MNPLRQTIIDSLIAISGWVLACPWVIADAGTAPASWSFHVAGALCIILGIVALLRPDDLPEYGLVAIAGWLVIAPWILGLADIVTRQSVMYGVVIGGMAWFGRPSCKPRTVPT